MKKVASAISWQADDTASNISCTKPTHRDHCYYYSIYNSTSVSEDQMNKSAIIKNTALDGKYWITCCNIFESLKVAKSILSVWFMTKLRLGGHLLIVWWLKTDVVRGYKMNTPTKTTTKYYKPVKVLPSLHNMEKIALWHGWETNTAQAEGKCCICLGTMPECYYFHIALAAVL